ncbi:MAG: NAD(P)/FAD-dependent oxidoreductase [Acidimicrobiia bacterium]|nr:NAD(P)/FAD-dependent oxidoreductase [Acidimicrobiia bacterium]
MARHRVVVVGAGFAGLRAARDLADVAVEVTIVDARNHHTFQPLLYQVATAGLDADDVCYATRGIFHRQSNARAIRAQVVGADLGARTVELADGAVLAYDHLVLAAGGVTADFGVPGVLEHGFGLKSAADAVAIRTHVLERFERCERDPSRIDDGELTLVVAGGGPTGVEMAGGFAELINHVLRRDFPSVDVNRARVVLIEAADRLLGTFAPKLGRSAERKLGRIGVEVLLGTQVDRVTASSVVLADGRTIDTGTLVWAAGIKANPLGAALGLEVDRGGRIVVDRDLRVASHPEILVIGDLAAARDIDGSLLPQVAPAAIQAGAHAAKVIKAELRGGRPVGRFRYRDKGSMATIGRNSAVVELPSGQTVTGLAGWVAWLCLHLVMLIGFRNRANVVVNWAWNYLTYDRASRLIIEDRPLPPRVGGPG